MPYLFTPPTQQVAVESRHPFWRRDTDTVARTVLKLGDQQYVTVDDPSNEQIDASVLPYLGGRAYLISDLEANDLIAAGYGDHLAVAGPFGTAFGANVFGAGSFGGVVHVNTYDGRS